MGEGCSIFVEKFTFCEDVTIYLWDPHKSKAVRRLTASYYIWRVFTKHTFGGLFTNKLPELWSTVCRHSFLKMIPLFGGGRNSTTSDIIATKFSPIVCFIIKNKNISYGSDPAVPSSS